MVEGVYTGARILACIYLAKTNRKVRTKSFVRRHVLCHLGNFSAMLCVKLCGRGWLADS